MTWVVGGASTLGYAVGMSDICVSFRDGSRRDCLQKIYPLARFIAVGFAGSVQIGFSMLDHIRIWLKDAPENTAWIPEETAEIFPEVARTVWSGSEPNEQALCSHLMLLAAHPTLDTLPGMSRCFAYIFRSPAFVREEIQRGKVESIRSGRFVESYKQSLEEFSANPLSMLRGEEMGYKQGTRALEWIVGLRVRKNPTDGVSPHFHTCRVERGNIQVWPNDEKIYYPNGDTLDFVMPAVAHSYPEFLAMVASGGRSAECAVC